MNKVVEGEPTINYKWKTDRVAPPVIPALRRLRQEDCDSKAAWSIEL